MNETTGAYKGPSILTLCMLGNISLVLPENEKSGVSLEDILYSNLCQF